MNSILNNMRCASMLWRRSSTREPVVQNREVEPASVGLGQLSDRHCSKKLKHVVDASVFHAKLRKRACVVRPQGATAFYHIRKRHTLRKRAESTRAIPIGNPMRSCVPLIEQAIAFSEFTRAQNEKETHARLRPHKRGPRRRKHMMRQ
jgi:hypothetical protein